LDIKEKTMNQKEFEEYFNNRYTKAVKWYDTKSIWNKRVYYAVQFSIIILAAITPILAILELKWPTTITASLVAIATGIIKFMKLEENWINYRTMCETLKKEPYLMKAELSDYGICHDKHKVFVDRVESLISREHTLWLSTITTKEKK
jgi:hypothetical protein